MAIAPTTTRPTTTTSSAAVTADPAAPVVPVVKPVRPDVELQKKAERRAEDLPRLRKGSDGKSVEKLQRLLKESGANPGPVDGDFGARTQAAVKRFQKSHELPQSGVVDKKTWTKLIKADLRRDFAFKEGQQDGAIRAAEERLKKLGYDTGKVDGFMDASTTRALKAFRADEGLGKSGALTYGVRKELRADAKALDHAPLRRRVKDTKAHHRLDAATASAAAKAGGIVEGAKTRAVKNVQAHLKAAGFDPSRTDGRFDERTEGALKQFQRKSGLPATGVVDTKTWNKLKQSQIEGSRPAQALNEKSGLVKGSEKLLKKLGFKTGKIDGMFDRSTLKAVKAFEKKYKRKVDGKISAGDLKKMKAAVKAKSTGGVGNITPTMRRLAAAGTRAAMGMGGYNSQGLCATGVSRAISSAMGIGVSGNGNQIDNNLPRSRFKQLHISLEQALKIPGLILTWERTSSAAGQKYGHTAITRGDGHTSMSDFIESYTTNNGRTGLKIFVPR